MINFSGVSFESDEIIQLLKRDIRLREVCQKVLYQRIIEKSASERGITVTPEEIQAEADRQRHEKQLERASDTLAWLAEQMITPDDWEQGIRDRLLSQNIAKSLFGKDVEKLFAENRLNFDQILLYQIIVTDSKLARELFFQIEEREISFYEAAAIYDINEKRRHQCGYEGHLDRWKLKPDIATVVFNAKPKELMGPLQTEQGYHLLMVEEFIPAELTPQRYQEILDNMFKDWLTSELNYMLHSQTDAKI